MRLGWKIFLPLSLFWVFVTASVLVFLIYYLILMVKTMKFILNRIKYFLLLDIYKGLFLTFRRIFKPSVTINYPYEKAPLSPRFRGNMLLEGILMVKKGV